MFMFKFRISELCCSPFSIWGYQFWSRQTEKENY